MPPKKEIQLINLEKFSVAQLPELQGKKEEIKSVIEANPIVEITNTETYESAKKSRTAVRNLRTSLEKEQKDVKRKIKDRILDVVDKEYDSLVLGVKTEENNRQHSVDIWEAEIEARKQEKIRLEQERIDGIKALLASYIDEWKGKFTILTFPEIEKVSADFYESYTNYDATVLQEFETLFPKMVEELTEVLNNKTVLLTDAENTRLEKLELDKQREDLKRKEDLKAKLGEFFNTWVRRIRSLSDSDFLLAKKEFEEIPVEDYQEFNDEYNKLTTELKEGFAHQREFIDLNKKLKREEEIALKEKEIAERRQAEIDAEQRKLAQEKADFELVKKEQQEQSAYQLKVDARIDKLVGLGLKFDFQQTFVGHDFFIDILDIKTYDDEKWNKLISDIETKISAPIEEAKPLIPEEEVSQELKAVQMITAVAPDGVAIDLDAIAEPTWDNIFYDFKLSGEKSLSVWLKINYNVPTKIAHDEN